MYLLINALDRQFVITRKDSEILRLSLDMPMPSSTNALHAILLNATSPLVQRRLITLNVQQQDVTLLCNSYAMFPLSIAQVTMCSWLPC